MKIKKDDTVIVLAGKDKGKTGKVLKAMPKDNNSESSCRDQAPGRPDRRIERNVL